MDAEIRRLTVSACLADVPRHGVCVGVRRVDHQGGGDLADQLFHLTDVQPSDADADGRTDVHHALSVPGRHADGGRDLTRGKELRQDPAFAGAAEQKDLTHRGNPGA